MVKEISEKEFPEVIKGNKVLVDFYANWCGPCKMLSPIVDKLSEEKTHFEFFKLDVDTAEEIASEYGIMSIPTLIIFEKGEVKNRFTGLMSKDELEEFLK